MIDVNADIVPVFVVDGERGVKKSFFTSRVSCEYLHQAKGRYSAFQENLMKFSLKSPSIVLVTEDVAQDVLQQVQHVGVAAGMFIVVPSYKGAAMAMAMAAYALKAQGRLMFFIDAQSDISRVASLDAILSSQALKYAEEKCVTFNFDARVQSSAAVAVCRPRVVVDLLQKYDAQIERLAQNAYFAYQDTECGRVVARNLYSDLPVVSLRDLDGNLKENSFVCLAVQKDEDTVHEVML